MVRVRSVGVPFEVRGLKSEFDKRKEVFYPRKTCDNKHIYSEFNIIRILSRQFIRLYQKNIILSFGPCEVRTEFRRNSVGSPYEVRGMQTIFLIRVRSKCVESITRSV